MTKPRPNSVMWLTGRDVDTRSPATSPAPAPVEEEEASQEEAQEETKEEAKPRRRSTTKADDESA